MMVIRKFMDSLTGAFKPTNTLNGTQHQRTLPPLPDAPLASASHEPPATKQKSHEPDTFSTSQSYFAIDSEPRSAPARRPSASSILSGDFPRKAASVQSSSKPASLTNVGEYRSVEKQTQPPKSKRKRLGKLPNICASSPQVLDDSDSIVDDGDAEKVDLIQAWEMDKQPNAPIEHQDKPLDEYRERFYRPSYLPSKPTASQPNASKRKWGLDSKEPRKQPRNSSPDPLSGEGEFVHRSLPQSRTIASKSESRRGEIRPTEFKKPPKAAADSRKGNKRPDIDHARDILGTGLRIKSAVDGRYMYSALREDPNEECSLRVHDVSTILLPTTSEGDVMGEYSYLAVDLKKSNAIKYETTPGHVVCIERSLDPGMSAGPKLLVEFTDRKGLELFVQWVQMERSESLQLSVQAVQDDKLSKTLGHMGEKATKSKVLRDSDNTLSQVPDDVKLMERQHEKRLQTSQPLAPWNRKPSGPPKLRDAMRPPPSHNHVREEESITIPESPTALAPVTRASRTRSVKLIDRVPTPKGWTDEHPNWEKSWRNSLVFPPQGKNRATVDKEDIVRLDEGQFLNDNLIIFGLRYLQDQLEKERPEIAKRVYFHNTFFYDKLKPSKSGAGINYDSVKGWTAKVDLFTKDFIVVPINEHAHWYVAIIYNAPKLIPEENTSGLDRRTETADDVDGIPSETEQAAITGQHLTVAHDISTLGESVPLVEEEMRRMSITSSNDATEPSGQDKQANKELQGGNQPTENEDVYEMIESDVYAAGTQPTNAASRRKAPKKSNSGQRKHDTSQPKIITLDSLGSAHSPACSYLRQYMVAELKDKKGLEVPDPGKLGITAKHIPLQENYCDCGLYLIGYIDAFQRDPDKFIHSLLQYGEPDWELNSSATRHKLRELIFELQRQQREREDLEEAEKRERKRKIAEQKRSKSRPSSSDGKSDKQSTEPADHATKSTVRSELSSALDICQNSTTQNTCDASSLLRRNLRASNINTGQVLSGGTKFNEPLSGTKDTPHDRETTTPHGREAELCFTAQVARTLGGYLGQPC
ncbi:hypothetical protein BKA67DRAFT_351143 [Truncatella angustata]|uniref:Ubiquitin-like protease family profile domain-containing protein n=1 Tax=Truncatella angustata TaxID=152316 RepID=A0A9P8UHJ4_9PEZI|nr:uncharacterized protein BKA67DRAFT_351143 [Truncatella angustata]KAH6652228.1 hypothetical protein BKA67DRAFT_351143 [Truncatella angustata]